MACRVGGLQLTGLGVLPLYRLRCGAAVGLLCAYFETDQAVVVLGVWGLLTTAAACAHLCLHPLLFEGLLKVFSDVAEGVQLIVTQIS
jgi:hypothetical protein